MEDKNISQQIKPGLEHKSFEYFIVKLFVSLGYHVGLGEDSNDDYTDLLITNPVDRSENYRCIIKYYSKPRFFTGTDVISFLDLSEKLNDGQKGILITTSICTEETQKIALDKNILILDLKNLIYLINPKHDLYQDFLSSVDFSIAKFGAKKPFMEFFSNSYEMKKISKSNKKINWEQKLKNIKPGKEDFSKYEKTCTEILKILFSDYLSIWQEQQKSNADLYRFDLICKIKNDVNDDFFSTLNSCFNTRYIIFDFKNYDEEITQKEIYTTEKYLYDKALRKVAIIVSRKGLDRNALHAVKGSIREQGKIIISLTDEDLLEMLKIHERKQNATDYMAAKLDKLLIELEK